MRTKKKSTTIKPEVEVKEAAIAEETAVKEPENKEIKEAEAVKETKVIEEVKAPEKTEEKPASKRRGRVPKEKEAAVEAPKKRGRKTAPKAAEQKAPEKKAAPAKKVAETTEEKVVLQFSGKEISTEDIIKQIKAVWVEQGHRAGAIKKLEIYIKPEEFAAYYVINEKNSGKIDL